MKHAAITFIVFLSLISSYAVAAEPKIRQSQVQESPRYQLVQVEYDAVGTTGDFVKKAVLKIDVFTGQTWILTDTNIKPQADKYISNRGWEKLEKNMNLQLQDGVWRNE